MAVVYVKSFWMQKRDNLPEEYEDAIEIDKEENSFAIADGATEGIFSREWAEILVENFLVNPTEQLDANWMQACYEKFRERVTEKELPWHAENKLITQGAFSTLATLKIDEARNFFQLIAIGDSCVFWHDNEGIHFFPYRTVEEFSNRPYLLCTLPYNNSESLERQCIINNEFSEGSTTFFLATDALSCWFIKDCLDGNKPWEELDRINSTEEFENYINLLRDSKAIKNDDVSLIIVSYSYSCEVDNRGLSHDERLQYSHTES